MLKSLYKFKLSRRIYKLLVRLGLIDSKSFDFVLFDGDDHLFKNEVKKTKVYAEYGCGASTIWVSNNSGCQIFSVDSSKVWIDRVRENCKNAQIAKLHHADLDEVGSWGRPRSYDKLENFEDYTDWIWTQSLSPDLVLVDGRFRVCCFLTSVINAQAGTRIIFDDYTNRRHYHIVEKFLKPVRTSGRQALFVVPDRDAVDCDEIRRFIGLFRCVFD